MTIYWSSLATLQAPLITPILPNTQWVAVVNPQAGTFKAETVASQVADQVGPRMTIYKTHEDPEQRLRDITKLIASKKPSLKNPLGVLAFGGDKTGSDAVMGALRCIFPHWPDLWESRPETAVERMLESGIQVGFVRLGGANDNGGISGAPANKIKEIMSYMDDALVTSLNLGVAFLGEEQKPLVFCHSLSAGETIAPVYEKTVEERGKTAKRHRERLFLGNAWAQRSFQAQWRKPGGDVASEEILEILIHSVVRADERMGLPGTPQPGLGMKIFPAKGRWNTVRMFQEVLWTGIRSLRGNPKGLGPDDRLKILEQELQEPLLVGEEREFRFVDADGNPFHTAIQSEGDYVDRANRILIRSLPPFPRVMVRTGSLAAKLRNR